MSIVLPKAVCTRTWRSRSLISFSAFSWQDSMIETHWVEGKKGPIIIPVINGQWKMSYFSKTKINHVYRIWKKAQNSSSGIVSNSPGFKFSGTFQMLFLSHASWSISTIWWSITLFSESLLLRVPFNSLFCVQLPSKFLEEEW